MQRIRAIQSQLNGPAPAASPVAGASSDACAVPSVLGTLVFSEEVRKALFKNGRPCDGIDHANACRVVALESTIISHGMPYPENVACARDLESIVRKAGAVPATIAVLDGVIHVGLSDAQLELLGKHGKQCAKCSRRDLPVVVARKGHGATTVSGTILVAQMAGIQIMATGGIGGVHRKGESTMDVSADLTELGRTRVLVVCAGVKSILDIPRTLEYLETQGVAVIGFQTQEFPAFFVRRSGSPTPMSVQSAQEAARYVIALRQLGYGSGGVLAVPIPTEHEAEGKVIEQAITKALAEVDSKKVLGRDITPFVLKRVNELTKGRSLKSNLALVRNNTRVAAETAMSMHHLVRQAPPA